MEVRFVHEPAACWTLITLVPLYSLVYVCVRVGLLAVIFSCWSRQTSSMDWDGAQAKGRIALWLAVAGLVVTVIAALVFVLIYFTKDT